MKKSTLVMGLLLLVLVVGLLPLLAACGGTTTTTTAATTARRSRSVSHALRTAAPFRSAPLDAAVAEVLGTLSVRVGMMRMAASGRPSASANWPGSAY